MQFKILGAWGIYLHKFHPTDFKLLLPECLWLINNLLLINSLCLKFLWFMKIKFNNEKCDSWDEYARFEKSLKATTRILIADMSALTVLVSDWVISSCCYEVDRLCEVAARAWRATRWDARSAMSQKTWSQWCTSHQIEISRKNLTKVEGL